MASRKPYDPTNRSGRPYEQTRKAIDNPRPVAMLARRLVPTDPTGRIPSVHPADLADYLGCSVLERRVWHSGTRVIPTAA